MSEFLEIIINNTSPALHYEGEWTSSRHDRALSGTLLTVPEGKRGSFFYNFMGVTTVFVQGLREDFSPDSHTGFSLDCEVTPHDPAIVYRSFVATADWATELFYICEVRNLFPTTSYTLNVTLESLRAPVVSFDALLLGPTATTDLDNSLVKMDHNHPMIQYDTNWESHAHGDTLHSTNTSGSTMQLDFNGTSLKWYTNWFFVIGISNISSEATWKVDDMEGKFTVPIPDPADGFSNFRQLLFETPQLLPGLHHLEVRYHGNTSTRPLSLRDLVIQSAFATPSSSPSMPTPDGATQGTPDSDATIPPGRLSESAKVAIGVSTAVAVVMIVAGLFFILHLRKRNSKQKASGPLQDQDTVATSCVNGVGRPSLAHPLTIPTSTTLDGISSTGTPVVPSATISRYPSPTNTTSSRHPHNRQMSISSHWPSRDDAPPPPYMASNPSDSPYPSSNQLSS